MSLTAILGAFSFVRSNWQLVLCGLLLAWAGIAQMGWDRCKAGRASDKAAQAQAVIEAQKKADTLSNELVIEQAKALAQIDQTLQPTKERIVRVPSTTVCRDSAPIRAAIDGVRGALRAGQPEAK